MKLKQFREESYYFSQRASEANQKLAIAGIALIWLFRIVDKDKVYFSNELLWAVIFFIASLAIEIIHYAPASFIWSIRYKTYKDNGINDNDDVDELTCVNTIGWVLFFLKLACLITGYVFFFIHVFKVLK